MFSLFTPSEDQVCEKLVSWRHAPLSYKPSSLAAGGFIPDEHRIQLGHGEEVFQAATVKLDNWGMFPEWAPVWRLRSSGQEVGDIVAMVTRIGGLWWVNPCRVLRRHDSSTTYGFTYGTLPDHAECGEEAFCIEKQPDGSVWYVIRAFSRPRHWMAWLAFPLARWWQCRFVRDSQQRMLHAP